MCYQLFVNFRWLAAIANGYLHFQSIWNTIEGNGANVVYNSTQDPMRYVCLTVVKSIQRYFIPKGRRSTFGAKKSLPDKFVRMYLHYA